MNKCSILCMALILGASRAQAADSTAAAPTAGPVTSSVVSLDGCDWLLATDPNSEGRAQNWCTEPRPEAKSAKVPWIIQDAFPGYHGVAWYWRRFDAPANPHAGGLMDLTFYRELIPDLTWSGQQPPAEVVAGAINTSQAYSSGLLVAVYKLGAGRFVLNTLMIREQLGRHPAAERLLRNMLRYAAKDAQNPPAELPDDFAGHLRSIGYTP